MRENKNIKKYVQILIVMFKKSDHKTIDFLMTNGKCCLKINTFICSSSVQQQQLQQQRQLRQRQLQQQQLQQQPHQNNFVTDKYDLIFLFV